MTIRDISCRLLHVDPSCRMNIHELMSHPWMTEAPDTVLQSPAVISDKVRFVHQKQICMYMYVPVLDNILPMSELDNTFDLFNCNCS